MHGGADQETEKRRPGVNAYDNATALIGRTVGYGCLVTSVLLLAYEVFARYVLNAPTRFTLEYGLICQILIAALAGAYVLQKGGHVGIDVIAGRLSARHRARLELVNQFCGALLCLLLAVIMFRAARYAMKMNMLSETMELPLAPLYWLFFLGVLMLAGQFISQAVKALRRARGD